MQFFYFILLIVGDFLENVDVSIIIVDYNAGSLIENCVNSIEKNVKHSYEIIISDNGSDKVEISLLRSLEKKYSNVKVIYNNCNWGFAKANNIAVNHACGKVYHFLNPDTLVGDDIDNAYKYVLQDSSLSMYATTLYENGIQVNNPIIIETFSCYWKHFIEKEPSCWYIGASYILRKDIFYLIEKWPEDYFMYSEDFDFCYIAYQKGIQILRLDCYIEHLGGGISRKVWTNFDRDVKKEVALIKFYKKYNLMSNYFIRKIIMLGKRLCNWKDLLYQFKVMVKALN